VGILGKLGGLLGNGVGGKIVDAISAVVENKHEATQLAHTITMAIADREHEIETLLIQRDEKLALAQAAINQVEASSDSLLKSGWRPMVGWVCVGGLFYQLIVQPLLAWVSLTNGWGAPPDLAMDTLLTLLFGILGLGAFRTYEKTKAAE
jgi:hypothetical protein